MRSFGGRGVGARLGCGLVVGLRRKKEEITGSVFVHRLDFGVLEDSAILELIGCASMVRLGDVV